VDDEPNKSSVQELKSNEFRHPDLVIVFADFGKILNHSGNFRWQGN